MRIHAAYFTNLAYYYGDRSTLPAGRGNTPRRRNTCAGPGRLTMPDGRCWSTTTNGWQAENGTPFWIRRASRLRVPPSFPAARLPFRNACRHAEGRRAKAERLGGGRRTGGSRCGCCGPARRCCGLARHNSCGPARNGRKGPDDPQPLERGQGAFLYARSVRWLEIGNGGDGAFDFEIEAPDWIGLSQKRGRVETEVRVLATAEDGRRNREGRILVKNLTDGGQLEIPVRLTVPKLSACVDGGAAGEAPVFWEDGGLVCVEADAAVMTPQFGVIPRAGRCRGSLVECRLSEQEAGEQNEPLRYRVLLMEGGDCLLEIHRFPSLNSTGRIRIGVSVDGERYRSRNLLPRMSGGETGRKTC